MNEYLRMLSEKRLTLIMSLPYNDPALCRAAFEAGASGLCAAAMAARNGSFPDQADIPLLRRRIAERGGIPGKRAAKGERTDVFGK